MGLTRKITSGLTLGAVDFRSDKERTAAYAKGTRRQAKKQTKLMERGLREQQRAGRETDADIEARVANDPSEPFKTRAELDAYMAGLKAARKANRGR